MSHPWMEETFETITRVKRRMVYQQQTGDNRDAAGGNGAPRPSAGASGPLARRGRVTEANEEESEEEPDAADSDE